MVNPASTERQLASEDTVPVVPERAAWSPTAIVWICLLFSILPAGIMHALNFERLGAPEKKKPALISVIIFSVIFYGFMFVTSIKPYLLPSLSDGTFRTLCTVSTLGMAWHFYLSQQPLFLQHRQRGGKKASIWPPVLLSLAGMVLVTVPAFSYYAWKVIRDQNEFNRAVTLMQHGKLDEAEAIFKAYRAEYPDEAVVHFNLGMVYAAKDRLPTAKNELQETLRLDPNFKDAKKYLHEVESDMKAEALH
jgi:hypothetical protein